MTKAELKQLDKIEFGRHLKRRCSELVEEYRIRDLRKKTNFKLPVKVKG